MNLRYQIPMLYLPFKSLRYWYSQNHIKLIAKWILQDIKSNLDIKQYGNI